MSRLKQQLNNEVIHRQINKYKDTSEADTEPCKACFSWYSFQECVICLMKTFVRHCNNELRWLASSTAAVERLRERSITVGQRLLVVSCHVTCRRTAQLGSSNERRPIRRQHAIKPTRQPRIRMLTDTDWACRRRLDF